MDSKTNEYPKFFDVNDIPVIIDKDPEDPNFVICKCANGMPHGIGKCYVDGYRITKEEYQKMARELYGNNFIVGK